MFLSSLSVDPGWANRSFFFMEWATFQMSHGSSVQVYIMIINCECSLTELIVTASPYTNPIITSAMLLHDRLLNPLHSILPGLGYKLPAQAPVPVSPVASQRRTNRIGAATSTLQLASITRQSDTGNKTGAMCASTL